MTRFNSLILLAIMLTLVFSTGCLQEQQTSGRVNDASVARHAHMQQLLHAMTGTIQDDLDAFNFSIDDVASILGSTGISGPEADSVVMDFATYHPAILSAITVDTNGIVLSAAPESATAVLGQNISNQEVIAKVLSTKEPAMGKYFTLRQGREGVAIVYPVFSPGGEFLGAVSMAFSPSILVTRYANEFITWTPFTYIVAQPDGILLYHSNPAIVGKPTFHEPLFERFPEVLNLARRYGTEPTGYAKFSFYKYGSTEIVPKETFWDTVSLHNTEWRVLVIAEEEKQYFSLPWHMQTDPLSLQAAYMPAWIGRQL